MIRFEGVSKSYSSGKDALKNINFSINEGEMVFVTGHSGAGKSTLLKLLLLLERPTKGAIFLQQQNITKLKDKKIPFIRRKFGVVYQNHQLLNDRTVFDNIALPLIISGTPTREIKSRVRSALDKVNLLNKEKLLPQMLSGGEQQRIGIARAVVNESSILIADEPTGNLDPELSAEIIKIFKDFNAFGVTVLIATHDLALLARMPHRSLILREGNLLGKASPNDAMRFDSQTF